MLWHIKLLRISSGLWICRSHSIWWKLDFCQLCNLTAGCNFNNQLLFSAFCSTSVGWIETNGVIYIPIVFCPLTVKPIWLDEGLDFFQANLTPAWHQLITMVWTKKNAFVFDNIVIRIMKSQNAIFLSFSTWGSNFVLLVNSIWLNLKQCGLRH